MIIFPNAKINIGLYVINRREDGYHDLETVLYPIKVKDILEVVVSDQLTFTSSGLSIPGDPVNNLCVKAYQLIRKDVDLPPLHIHLYKQIAIGAGLGGGSSDAAFFIKLVNRKFALNLSSKQMQHYAQQLGADCAFFIGNEPVFATGKGDQFEPVILGLDSYYIILVIPPVHVSTKEAYAGVEPSISNDLLKANILLPVEEWRNCIENSFETSIFKTYPVIGEIKSAIYQAGALYASMSGSGSSVYGIFKSEVKLPILEKNNQVYYNVGL